MELCFPVTRIPNQTEINNQDKNNEILAWFALSSWPKIQFDIDGNKPGKAGDLVTDSHNLEDSPLPTAPGPRRVCVGCAPVTGVVCGSDLGEQGEYSVGGSKFAPVTGVVCGSDLGEQGEY